MAHSATMPETFIHDLFSRKIRPIRDWHEWLEHWNKAETLEQMLGLLHVGPNLPIIRSQYNDESQFDWAIFYLELADGWNNQQSLMRKEDGTKWYILGDSERKIQSQLRQILARKAYDMLCSRFFEMDVARCGFAITSDRFSPLQNFFRVEGMWSESCANMPNMRCDSACATTRSHGEEKTIGFLINLAKFMWNVGEERDIEAGNRISAAKPWMIEVLSYLGKLDFFNTQILTLDKSCLAKLEDIALRSKLDDPKCVNQWRRVATLDEACFTGSPAAWLLKKNELARTEHVRLDATKKA